MSMHVQMYFVAASHTAVPHKVAPHSLGKSRLDVPAWCRFGGLLHDWPDSYFKAQQSKGDGLAGIFKQAMGQHQIQKVTRTRSVLARLFPASQFSKLLGAEVRT